MRTKVKNIVERFKGKITILQVLYEALSNSLEANAEKIKIVFHCAPSITDNKVYDCFSIIDDGDGFTKNNIDSFLEYLSDYKYKLGCKGIGRFTWLKVFSLVKIHSVIGHQIVDINFNLDFEETKQEDLSVSSSQENHPNCTRIDFTNCILSQTNYVMMPLEEIRQTILNTFAIKLYLLSESGRSFDIEITDDSKESSLHIGNSDLLQLEKVNFSIAKDGFKADFKIYYKIYKNQKGKNQVVLCADNRGIEDANSNGRLIPNLPNNDSMICLIKSEFLNGVVNDMRTGFVFTDNDDSLFDISRKELEDRIKRQIETIVLDNYPFILEDNKQKKSECIEKYPYLKKYILDDDSLIVDEKKIIEKSEVAYTKDKSKASEELAKAMMSPIINEKELVEGIINLNDFSNRELAKYFLYRQQIIDCLGEYIRKNEPVEKLLHDLFIPQGTILGDALKDKLRNNIWLLDDKFMSYLKAFSDKKVKNIVEEIKNCDLLDGTDDGVEPDLALFYSNKTTVVVEFKALGANYNKKIDAITEINRNNGIIASNFDDINSIYGYIITDFDDVFLNRIKYQNGVKRMFDNNNEQMFYYYNENIVDKNNKPISCHTYIVSAKSIYADANARNKLFIDLIKESS